jgi:hypothetical protein
LNLREIVGGIQSEPYLIKGFVKQEVHQWSSETNGECRLYNLRLLYKVEFYLVMANPRQRRKARSSSHRPISHSRHAKRNMKKVARKSYAPCILGLNSHDCFLLAIRGPKALQDAWDKQKTVHQK